MKFSVIIPVYNVEKYIQECLQSLIQQTVSDFEAIIINDGSSDESRNIAESLTKDDKRFSIIDRSNGGQASARNLGLKAVSGDYVVFLDSDDWIEKDTLETIDAYIREYNPDIISFGYRYQPSGLISTPGMAKSDFGRLLPISVIINKLSQKGADLIGSTCWRCYRRQMIVKNQILFDEDLQTGEDGVFNLTVYQHASNYLFMDAVLYNYRYNPDSLVNKYYPNKFDMVIKAHLSEDEQLKILSAMTDVMVNRRAISLLEKTYNCMLNIFHPDNSSGFKEKFQELKYVSADRDVQNAVALVKDGKLRQLGRGSRIVFWLVIHKIYIIGVLAIIALDRSQRVVNKRRTRIAN
jgi:glycosyltransferase involved in cell wall biosynthesis